MKVFTRYNILESIDILFCSFFATLGGFALAYFLVIVPAFVLFNTVPNLSLGITFIPVFAIGFTSIFDAFKFKGQRFNARIIRTFRRAWEAIPES